ncbi:MAG TPA: LamB/YcsF family protein, partial [Candidatus Eisenbacteria bacterium]
MNHTRSIDLNADVGEIPELQSNGTEARLIAAVSSVNIACGGHAGDISSVETAVRTAIAHGVAIGGHPSYPDRANFGRVVMEITHHDLMRDIYRQVVSLMSVAREHGAVVRHVKPHGALYNAAVDDANLAAVIAKPLAEWRDSLTLVGL